MAPKRDVDITEPGPVHQQSLPDTLWTTINAAEQMPGVLSPLGFTYWIGPADRGVKGAFHALGILPRREVVLGETPDQRVGGAFFGRWVGNVDEFRRLADLTPGMSGAAFEQDVFGSFRPDLPARTRRSRYPVVAVKAPATVARLPRQVSRAAIEIRDWWRHFTSPAGQARPAVAQLGEALERTQWAATVQMVAALVGQGMFDKLGELAEQAGRPDLYLRLSSGYGGLEETRMISALYDIAHRDGTIEEFLQNYGARCPSEVELSVRSWRENPVAVQRLVDRYRTAPDRPDPLAEAQARSRGRIVAERELLAGMTARKRPGARLLLRLAQTYIPLREEGKSVMVTAIDGGRSAARARGRELAGEGVIADPEDVFFLTLDEVLGDPPRDARSLVEHRRALAVEYAKVNVPVLWSGMPEPVVEQDAASSGDEVTGIGAAPGTARGVVRVITDADDCDQLEPDEILVCRITDPSWASAFHLAAAVVIDIGGLASHGAIVCRELGLPCVINTGNGTRALRTGDLVEVDGSAGTVRRR